MLTLEIIGVLGALYGFFVLATLKAYRVGEKVETEKSRLAPQEFAQEQYHTIP